MATPDFEAWRARPIFISSTFKDMQAERDLLRTHVFPRLEEELRKRRHLLEPIDLRIGVETADLDSEQARELLVLKVCLDEIQRSRPFMIVLLGDRYGWVPPSDRMETAVREAGFQTDVRHKSVTALEIEFGVLRKTSEQRLRTFFYLRAPLPYDRMPAKTAERYSDLHSSDASVRAGHARLENLKRSLRTDAELSSRVFDYGVEWDNDNQCINDLRDWGELVFKHLWEELKDDTRDFAEEVEETWMQREEATLRDFVVSGSRDFTGREEMLKALMELAHSPAIAGASWGACISGEPGSGKSSLMAELIRRLSADKSILVLSNAAGATPRGRDPDAMLFRFLDAMAQSVNHPPAPPELLGSNDVEDVFYGLLAKIAENRRVVIVLDAIDQFDNTPRGQEVTWVCGRVWPANARLIATGLPGTAPVEALSQWAGVEEISLPLLNPPDIAEIARRIWARYHRQVNPEVLRVLVEKRLPEGSAAAGNPLWLTLALEQLNLLDADDFARADRDYAGGPAERLRAMLVDMAARMPADIPLLYDWLLEQTEKVFGLVQARAFAALIALSRFGWRDNDLLQMVPAAAAILFPDAPATGIDALGLAALRRGFRAHLVRRGVSQQFDFFHLQMRQAVWARAISSVDQMRALHRVIAVHLVAQPENDPLRESDLMRHWLGAADASQAALLIARAPHQSSALSHAIVTLGQFVLACEGPERDARVAWLEQLPALACLGEDDAAEVAARFNFLLDDVLSGSVNLKTRQRLKEAAERTLLRLLSLNPANEGWMRELAACVASLGQLLLDQGLRDEAQKCFDDAIEVLGRLLEKIPDNPIILRDLAGALSKQGGIAQSRGDFANAEKNLVQALQINYHLIKNDPGNIELRDNVFSWTTTLSRVVLTLGRKDEALQCLDRCIQLSQSMAEAFPSDNERQTVYACALANMGGFLSEAGQFEAAWLHLSQARGKLAVLTERDPKNTRLREHLATALSSLGDVLVKSRNATKASPYLEQAYAIYKGLADSDPDSADWQRECAVAIGRLGNAALCRSDFQSAEVHFLESLSVSRALIEKDPRNVRWLRDSMVALQNLGLVGLCDNDFGKAERYFKQRQAVVRDLIEIEPSSPLWWIDLASGHYQLAETARSAGRMDEQAVEQRNALAVLKQMKSMGMPLDEQWDSNYRELMSMFSNG